MTALVYDLPLPPDGEEWCSGCVMLLRGKVDKEYHSQAVELAKDGRDEVKLIRPKVPGAGRLRVAVVSAPFALAPELGLMRVCWTCAAGMAPVAQSSLARPGLARG